MLLDVWIIAETIAFQYEIKPLCAPPHGSAAAWLQRWRAEERSRAENSLLPLRASVQTDEMNRRRFLKLGTAATVGAALGGQRLMAAALDLPAATAGKLPRWRGFNLLEKFVAPQNRPYVEKDFEWLAGWGFNFVRLPMDYRCWAKRPEDADFDEATMREIDQAVAWGRQYGVHVNMNFHRGPGYCVNQNPKEPGDLWNEAASQEQFARHWGVFAKRYHGIPGRQLSFDLINEPPQIEGAKYAAALKPAIDAIRGADPQRLIIADGIAWGTKPVPELIPFGIAQSTRGYEPMEVSHYQASWIPGSDKLPVPVWPIPKRISGFLYGPEKQEFQGPLTLEVQCPQATPFSLHVNHVSHEAGIVVKADGVTVFQHLLKPGPGAGEWKQAAANRWGTYDGDYDRDFTAGIPAGTREIEVSLDQGDWLTFSSIGLNGAVIKTAANKWGQKQEAFIVDGQGARAVNAGYACSKETLWEDRIKLWLELEAKGVGVHVGEWGAYNHTPHDVALAWMRDCLENWRKAGFGWSLWNLRGGFGILDSERADVAYEDFQGHKLDRAMLELLRAG